jgi:hypothetical protein
LTTRQDFKSKEMAHSDKRASPLIPRKNKEEQYTLGFIAISSNAVTLINYYALAGVSREDSTKCRGLLHVVSAENPQTRLPFF